MCIRDRCYTAQVTVYQLTYWEMAISLGSNRHYLIVHSLTPYFCTYFMKDLTVEIGYFTVYFDETTTWHVKKQMDLHIAYWSPSFKKVVSLLHTHTHCLCLEPCETDKNVLKFTKNLVLILQFLLLGPRAIACIENCSQLWWCKKWVTPWVVDGEHTAGPADVHRTRWMFFHQDKVWTQCGWLRAGTALASRSAAATSQMRPCNPEHTRETRPWNSMFIVYQIEKQL